MADDVLAPLEMHCSWCGPWSLRGHGERRVEKCECSVERTGFGASDVHLYVKCQGCGERITKECLESIHKALDAEPWDASIHDPLGVWSDLKHRAWVANKPTTNFVPSHGNEGASFVHCILCEDCDLPEAVDPIPPELKAAVVQATGPSTSTGTPSAACH